MAENVLNYCPFCGGQASINVSVERMNLIPNYSFFAKCEDLEDYADVILCIPAVIKCRCCGALSAERKLEFKIYEKETVRLEENGSTLNALIEIWNKRGTNFKAIKSEVAKEFAKRLQAKAQFSEDFGDAAVSYDDIDNLVKEMTEEHYEAQ